MFSFYLYVSNKLFVKINKLYKFTLVATYKTKNQCFLIHKNFSRFFSFFAILQRNIITYIGILKFENE